MSYTKRGITLVTLAVSLIIIMIHMSYPRNTLLPVFFFFFAIDQSCDWRAVVSQGNVKFPRVRSVGP